MMNKLTLFLTNWKTSVPALMAMLCVADSQYMQMLPPEWEAKAQAICTLLLAFGLLAAKDGDKTNSGTAGPAKTLSVVFLALILTGCAGTMLDGRFCTIATAGETRDLMNQVVDTHFSPESRQKAEQYLATAGLGATALCEVLRAREAAELAKASEEKHDTVSQ